MADEVNIRMRVDGVQADAAFRRTRENIDSIGRSLRGTQSNLKATGQVFNQFGNLAASLGANELARFVNQIEGSVIAFRSMNAEMGRSRLAAIALGSAVAVAGFQLGSYLRQFVPGLNAADVLNESTAMQERILETQRKITALRSPEKFGGDSAFDAVNKEIQELEVQYRSFFGIQTGLTKQLTEDQQALLDKLRELREELRRVRDEAREEKGAELLQSFNQRRLEFFGTRQQGETGAEFTRFAKQSRAIDELQVSEKLRNQIVEAARYDHELRLSEIHQRGEDHRLEVERQAMQRRLEIQQQGAQATSDIFGNLATTARAFGKEGFAAWKAFSIAQATVDTYKSAIAAYAATVGIPVVGPALAPVAAAAAVAAGIANIAQIAATNPQGYALGGYTGDGGRFEAAGTVHRGEYVMPAPTVERLGVANLDAIRAGAPNVNVGSPNVVNVMVSSQSELRSFLKSRAGRDEIINIVRTEKLAMGLA